MEKWIESSFKFYLKKVNLEVLKEDSLQYVEMKRAFYAGVSAFYTQINDHFSSGTPAADLLIDTHKECSLFWEIESTTHDDRDNNEYSN